MKKPDWLLIVTNICIVLAPYLIAQVGLFAIPEDLGDADQAAGMGIGLMSIIVLPLTLIIGVVTSLITRRSERARMFSMLGYGIPSFLWLLAIIVILVPAFI